MKKFVWLAVAAAGLLVVVKAQDIKVILNGGRGTIPVCAIFTTPELLTSSPKV